MFKKLDRIVWNLYFSLRFGFVYSNNTYLKLRIRGVCGVVVDFSLKCILIEFVIPILSLNQTFKTSFTLRNNLLKLSVCVVKFTKAICIVKKLALKIGIELFSLQLVLCF